MVRSESAKRSHRPRGASIITLALLFAAVTTLVSCDASRPSRGTGGAGGGGGSGSLNTRPAWQWTVACPDGHDATTPIDYGRCAVDQALAELGVARAITLAKADDPAVGAVLADVMPLLDARAESYVIAALRGTTWVVGRDDVGAMYGALELAERLRLNGAGAVPPPGPLRGVPTVAVRAANLFWTTPDPYESSWWFLDESYWRQYLDLMAHARLDLLDLHGMYDPVSTVFPNALLYLARSASFPEVGVPAADRERNMAMLNKVIALAKARGIRVGLMTYQAGASVDGGSNGLDDASLKIYDREAAADIATRLPDLAMFGFRIGESGKDDATWYIDSLVAGARQARPDLALSTRTWGSNKPAILALAAAIGPNMVVEAKFNGEQLGAPYAIAGGVFSTYGSYSYQGYLAPPAPWSFVFQVRAAGTHRIFRQASYERTRRTVLSLGMSPAIAGFTIEGTHAYAQQRDDYHRDATDRLSPWTFLRDDLMYLEWGRLGYDPNTPEATFRALAAREAGTDTLWPAIQAGSDIVPWIQTAHTCGPDHRNFEPEMELGGDVAQWAELKAGGDSCKTPGPFDSFAIAKPIEVASDLTAGVPTSRISPIDVAARVLDDADRVEAALALADVNATHNNVLARDIAREAQALADLGRHFAHKLRAATALDVFARTGAPAWLATARAETQTADDAWRKLADDTAYIKPFRERLRMATLGYDPFHWSMLVSALDADTAALNDVAASVAASPPPTPRALPDPVLWLTATRLPGPGLTALTVSPALATSPTWLVDARFATPVPPRTIVNVLWKQFDSEKDWVSASAFENSDGGFSSALAGSGAGALFAVEVITPTGAWRYPDAMTSTPYISVPP